MHQVAQSIWNRIAQSQELASTMAKILFGLSDEEIDATLDRQADAMAELGIPNKVIIAYQTVLPLYMESPAITEYIREKGRDDLRGALPEVLTRRGAGILMQMEYRLTDEQRVMVEELIPHEEMGELAKQVYQAWLPALPERFRK